MSHRAFRKDEVSETEAKLRRKLCLLLVRESRQRLTTSRKKVQLCLPNTMRIGVLGSALVRACCSFSVCAIRLQGFLPYHGVALFDWLGVKHQQRFGLFFKCKIH